MQRNGAVGIMQGRLSPAEAGRIQSFPRQTWQAEFHAAARLGLSCIEWVFEEEAYETNPLLTSAGQQEIRRLVAETGVGVQSVCADFFMSCPLHKGLPERRERSLAVFDELLRACEALHIATIVLPCVDAGGAHSEEEEKSLEAIVRNIHPRLLTAKTVLAIESDYPPRRLTGFLRRLSLPMIKLNYDTGNSASLGYAVEEEVGSYGEYIASVHLKDRRYQGSTVPFGAGDTRFADFFCAIKRTEFKGAFIIQGARGEDDVDVAQSQLRFVRRFLVPSPLMACLPARQGEG